MNREDFFFFFFFFFNFQSKWFGGVLKRERFFDFLRIKIVIFTFYQKVNVAEFMGNKLGE